MSTVIHICILSTRLTVNQRCLTLQFGAAVSATVVLAVGVAVHHLWDADQESSIVPEDHHGQLAPALLHQVLGLQQRQVFRCHAVDLVKEVSFIGYQFKLWVLYRFHNNPFFLII